MGGRRAKNIELPKIAGVAAEGTRLVTSNGTWSGGPVVYAYQWEDCNSSGGECSPILDAINPNYTPKNSDVGHTLSVRVSAINGDGSFSVTTPASSVVRTGAFVYSSEFSRPAKGKGWLERPGGLAINANGDLWILNTGDNNVLEFNSAGEYMSEFGSPGSGNGQFKNPSGMAIDSHGDIWISDMYNDRVQEFNEKGEYLKSFGSEGEGNGEFKEPGGIAVDTHGNLWVADTSNHRVEEFNEKGEYLKTIGSEGSSSGEFEYPQGVAVDSHDNVWVTDRDGRVEEFNEKGEFIREFGTNGTADGQLDDPYGITVEPTGDVLVFDNGNSRVQEFTEKGEYLTQFGSPGEGGGQFEGEGYASLESTGIVLDSKGDVWVTAGGEPRIEKWTPGESPTDAETASPQPGATVEYDAPISGEVAPYQMGNREVETWSQSDDPEEAAAIFPPDEPQTWPATNFRRATVYYLDSDSRTVNVASPTGGISTQEYNENNDVIRSLSPDNRVSAIKTGGESAKLLSTESKYNGETKEEREKEEKESGSGPGTRLLETLGPQHTVKLAQGKEKPYEEVLARDHVKYYYDEGAPSEGGPYDLVTKETEGAQTVSKEEFDKRESVLSYAGQGNLGWELRKATSTTTDPDGLHLVHTTEYEPTTGNIEKTKLPASSGKDKTVPPIYSSRFGTKGKENGEFTEPRGVAIAKNGNVYVLDSSNSRIEEFSPSGTYLEKFGSSGKEKGQMSVPYAMTVDSKGNIWVADTGNQRIDEFNEKLEFVQAFGFGVSNGEEKLQVCTSTCRAGIAGANAGQFKEPKGISVTVHGDVYIADSANDRVEEFNEKGEFIAAFGFGVTNEEAKFEVCTSSCKAGMAGSGDGEFNAPRGVAANSSDDVWVVDDNNNRIEEFNEKDEYVSQFGSKGTGNGQFKEPKGITIDSNGNILIADSVNNRVQKFTSSGGFLTSFGSAGTGNGQFEEPWGVAETTSGDIYIADVKNDRVEEWSPTITGSEGAHNTKTIYYSVAANSEYPGCGEHAEWANLPCRTETSSQPGTSGLPELPFTKITYNVWDEPEKTTETVGTTIREETDTYDTAGRLKTSAISSSVGTSLPTVTDAYNEKTGVLETQSTTAEGKTKRITSEYNSLGQLASYTDADEATTTYEYDEDGRIKSVNDGKE
jgi:YD repeat-containing protein